MNQIQHIALASNVRKVLYVVSTVIMLSISVAFGQDVTIEYWHVNTETFGAPTLRELISEFEAENPDIKVIERFQPNVYTGLLQNLQTALAAGSPPDVAQIGYLYMSYVFENFPFVPITDLIDKYGGQEHLAQFPESVLELGQVQDVQLGMPFSLSNIVTYYNADLLRQAGLDPDEPPATWDEWREAAQQIKEETGKPGIYIQVLDDNWTTEALIEGNGGTMIECEAGVPRAAFDSPAAVDAIQLWADLVADDLALNVLQNQGEQAFLAGETATYITTIGKRQILQESAPFELRGTGFPQFGSKPSRLPSGGNALVVFAQDPAKQEAAWKFVQFLTSAEGFTAWTKGTGYVPPLAQLSTDEKYLKDFIEANPIQQVAVNQIPNTYLWVSIPGSNGLAAQQEIFQALQRSLNGQATAQEAFSEAAQQVNSLLQGETCNP